MPVARQLRRELTDQDVADLQAARAADLRWMLAGAACMAAGVALMAGLLVVLG